MISNDTKIIFYCDTEHTKKLFSSISDKLNNSFIITQNSIKSVKETPIESLDIINKIENEYAKYIRYKYDTPYFSLRATIKKWQRLGFSEHSLQRRYRRHRILKEFKKWVTFFRNTDSEILAAWCPIKPKRKIVFEAARLCKKSLLYFEDSPIPGFITCDHKGINGGLSLERNIDSYLNIQKNEFNKNDLDLTRLFEGIKQRKAISKKFKSKKNNIYNVRKKTIYCPLQVQDDTQIVKYGNWIKSIGQFINLIHEASKMLPENWQIVIREHPSCGISFKKTLLALSNERFVIDNNSDSTDIINRAEAVVTINSSVGFHALLKNKPVIVCGDAFWGFQPISYPVSSKSELFDIFYSINSLESDINSVKRYVGFLLKRKFFLANYDKGNYKINSNGMAIIHENMLESLNYYRNK